MNGFMRRLINKRLTKRLDKDSTEMIEVTKMTHLPVREIHFAGDDTFNDSLDAFRDIVNSLGQREDIDADMGVNIFIMCKAFEDGIWVKDGDRISFISHDSLSLCWHIEDNEYEAIEKDVTYYHTERLSFNNEYLLEDFGETWALNREDLE